jgi:hypothetical protein
MAFLFRKQKKNNSQTRIVRHEPEPAPEPAREIRWETHDLEVVHQLAPQRAAFTGFNSPPGRF